ncbi:BMP family ABC transporter substrate-binding protein [soil metagenome]
MKLRTHRLPALLGALALVLAACGGDDSVATSAPDGDTTVTTVPETNGDGPSFIYITPNPIGVNKFLELGQIGTERAAERLGGTWKTFESTDQTTRRANVEAAVDEAPDIIVLTTFQLVELAEEFSMANPNQKFILIDTCPAEPAPNLHCAVFREHEASYLLGIMAGNLTEAGRVGSVVATDIPFLHRYSDSFALGAQSIDESITDSQLFIEGDNAFSDPARAKEQALALAAQGADHIFAVGAGSNGGIFEAAQEQGFLTYGVDVNQCPDSPGNIVDNAMKLVDNATEQLIDQILAGDAPNFASFGLAEAGTGVVALGDDLADSECVIADHPDIVEQVREAAADIIDGTIEIPDPLAG